MDYFKPALILFLLLAAILVYADRSNDKDGLEPIVIDHGKGRIEVRDGHIATDPRYIPTNSELVLLVRIQGEVRVLKVKATDIGGAVKGMHVDLPIQVGPEAIPLPDGSAPKQVSSRHPTRLYPPLTLPPPSPSR